jgi:tripartite ATP-independent transporter DctM subunit
MTSLLLLTVLGLFLLAMIFSRVEIAFAIGIMSATWLLLAGQPLETTASRAFAGLDKFVLLAIPFFLLAGEVMNRSEITERLVRIANVTIGRIRGGLAQANVLASLLFAGITGAAVADVAALGSIFVPSMVEEGYDRDFSAALTAASSIIGPIIPPSIIIVIYGAVTNNSIGGLFAAAVIPGIILAAGLMVSVAIFAHQYDLPSYDADVDRSEYSTLAIDAVVAASMPGIILFGIIGGYFTPTEAAAVACAYGTLIGAFFYRSLSISDLYKSMRISIERSAQLYAIIGFASVLSWTLAAEGIQRQLATAVAEAQLGVLGFMVVVSLILLFVGTWLEIGAAAIILGPTFNELAVQTGIHEFQFGIMMIVALNFGLITPPLGVCLFAASSVSRRPVWPIAKKIAPFFVVDLVVLALLIYFPQLTLWVPRQTGFI